MIAKKVQKAYLDFIKEPYDMTTYTKEQDEWYSTFEKILVFQQYNESDLKQAVDYMIGNYDPSYKKYGGLDLSNAPRPIKRLLDTYTYKVITAFFTKGAISYSIFKFNEGPHKYRGVGPRRGIVPYFYLENLLSIIRIAIKNINEGLRGFWSDCVRRKYDDSEYVLSGGSIFILFAGLLCYINSGERSNELLNTINEELFTQLGPRYDNFRGHLRGLFLNPEFNKNVNIILSGASDLDFIYMAKDNKNVNFRNNDSEHIGKQISNLSALVLNRMLNRTYLNNNDETSSLFPFFGEYNKPLWTGGRIYDQTRIPPDVKSHFRNVTKFTGYRQTSNYINELPIYLNRIKQGYFPYCRNGDGDGIVTDRDEIYEYMNKYGECIDLVVGSRTSSLFRAKHEYYKMDQYYSIDNLKHELDTILAGAADDKSLKRIARQEFLVSLQSSPFNEIYDGLLMEIGNMIHKSY